MGSSLGALGFALSLFMKIAAAADLGLLTKARAPPRDEEELCPVFVIPVAGFGGDSERGTVADWGGVCGSCEPAVPKNLRTPFMTASSEGCGG
jgi:hypothetical protein